MGTRGPSTVSRTPSVDSRVHGEAIGEAIIAATATQSDANGNIVRGAGGVAVSSTSPKSWRVSPQISTPSVEKEFR